MNRAYDTYGGWSGQANGRGRDGAARRDNVIDLAAWREAHEEISARPEEPVRGSAPRGRSACRARRDRSAEVYAELAATLAVVGVLAALIVRILTF